MNIYNDDDDDDGGGGSGGDDSDDYAYYDDSLHSTIGYRHHNVVCLSVTVYCGAQGRSSTVVFVAGNFILTFSYTFAVGCIVQPQHTAKNRTAEISASEIPMDSVVT